MSKRRIPHERIERRRNPERMTPFRSKVIDAMFVISILIVVLVIFGAMSHVEQDPKAVNVEKFERSWWVVLPDTTKKDSQK